MSRVKKMAGLRVLVSSAQILKPQSSLYQGSNGDCLVMVQKLTVCISNPVSQVETLRFK